MPIDKNDFLKTIPFSWRTAKDAKLFISYEGTQVMILKEKKAAQILKRLDSGSDFDKQLVLAKVTGNFKRGNERNSGECLSE